MFTDSVTSDPAYPIVRTGVASLLVKGFKINFLVDPPIQTSATQRNCLYCASPVTPRRRRKSWKRQRRTIWS